MCPYGNVVNVKVKRLPRGHVQRYTFVPVHEIFERMANIREEGVVRGRKIWRRCGGTKKADYVCARNTVYARRVYIITCTTRRGREKKNVRGKPNRELRVLNAFSPEKLPRRVLARRSVKRFPSILRSSLRADHRARPPERFRCRTTRIINPFTSMIYECRARCGRPAHMRRLRSFFNSPDNAYKIPSFLFVIFYL